jgi:hypothetical protein
MRKRARRDVSGARHWILLSLMVLVYAAADIAATTIWPTDSTLRMLVKLLVFVVLAGVWRLFVIYDLKRREPN